MACAPTRDPYGLALRQNPEQVPSAVPDSLRADLGITPRKKGAPSFGARFYARPHQQYRMDALGLTSIAASFLWDRGQWALVLHDKREVWTGKGDTLDVKDMPVRLPGVHALLGFLWGDPLPDFRDRDSGSGAWSGDTLHWSAHGTAWKAIFDPNGLCLSVRSSSLEIAYRGHRKFGTRILPQDVEVFAKGESLLLLRVNGIEDVPSWSRNPFVLKIPEGYEHRSMDDSLN
ncbi:MAG TPA: hypothetical protein DCQ83_02325 [Fibrobacteres bacterium]|nr:hypothetical protein [Fibrobacterota bacterium]